MPASEKKVKLFLRAENWMFVYGRGNRKEPVLVEQFLSSPVDWIGRWTFVLV